MIYFIFLLIAKVNGDEDTVLLLLPYFFYLDRTTADKILQFYDIYLWN